MTIDSDRRIRGRGSRRAALLIVGLLMALAVSGMIGINIAGERALESRSDGLVPAPAARSNAEAIQVRRRLIPAAPTEAQITRALDKRQTAPAESEATIPTTQTEPAPAVILAVKPKKAKTNANIHRLIFAPTDPLFSPGLKNEKPMKDPKPASQGQGRNQFARSSSMFSEPSR